MLKYMPCANGSLLCHALYHNGYLSIICPKCKESENSDTFQFNHLPILTLSDSDTFRFYRGNRYLHEKYMVNSKHSSIAPDIVILGVGNDH